MKANQLFEHLIDKRDLNPEQMHTVIHQCMNGQFNDLQIATFLALIRMKGETTKELIAAAEVMRELSNPIYLGTDLIDIVGTGGDGKNTFNVSTASSFVVAASGYKVAKHGNRSVSSRSGSADLLEEAGISLNLSDEHIKTCMQQCHLAFLFAPHYHPAMLQVRNARQQLGIRTLFNLLGPLINPARVKKQVVGVFSRQWLKPLATVLAHLGSEHSLVVSSLDGLDEISVVAPTEVLEYQSDTYTSWMIDPKRYGMHYDSLDKLVVDSPQTSLHIIKSVLNGADVTTAEQINSLPYLKACIRESHRLTPSSTVSAKKLEKDVDIVVNDKTYRAKAGTQICLNLCALPWDEQYVDNPLEYRPERFMPDAIEARKGTPSEIIDHPGFDDGFGRGKRRCLGANVAKAEIIILAARLIQDWEVTLADPSQRDNWVPKQYLMLKADPYPDMKLTPRQ